MSEMTELEKEDVYGVAWIIFRESDGIPDTTSSMYQSKHVVRQGTIPDLEKYLESIFFDVPPSTDPLRAGKYRALKVSKEGKAIYGDYSVPLCTWKLGERWKEKDLLMARAYQITVLIRDKRFDCVLNRGYGYLMDVPRERKDTLRSEWEALDKEGLAITKRLEELGVSFNEQLTFISDF